MNLADFYEAYWQRPGGSPADFGFLQREREVRLEAALSELAQGERVLDAGCGNGSFCRFMTGLGYRVCGIDIAKGAVDRAKAASTNGSYLVASLESGIPFDDREFAAIWSTEVLEHLFDVHAALAEFNRVLERDGLLILTTPYHGLVKNLLVAMFGFERHYDPYLSHLRFFTRKSLNSCLERAGFSVVSWSGIGRRWPVWMSHFVVARKIHAPFSSPTIAG